MPKIAYQKTNFRYDTLTMIEDCNKIIAEYMADDLRLTLRQLYYQIVSRDLFPKHRWYFWNGSKWVADPECKNEKSTMNNQPNYNWLGNTINDARLAGLIDWMAIEDLTRNLLSIRHSETPEKATIQTAENYRLSKWLDQDNYPEVWIEKQALQGIFDRICCKFDVPFLPCRGYMSQSEMWESAMRYVRMIKNGKHVHILHFGDHDPSGIDMTRDIEDRLRMFISHHLGYATCQENFTVKRIALNMDQVKQYNPPENPAKTTDTRFAAYQALYGDSSWELDALNPRILLALIREEITSLRDMNLWNAQIEQEAQDRAILSTIANNWDGLDGVETHVQVEFEQQLADAVDFQQKELQEAEVNESF